MAKLGILADDLTGAAEAAVACRRLGHRTLVSTEADGLRPCDEAVAVLDTHTRHAPPAAAAHAVRNGAAALQEAGCNLLHKKTDSVLRGNIASELSALLDAAPTATLVYAPAFPGAGRTVREGVLRVHGVRVADTEFHDDPLSPVQESSVPALLRSGGHHPVRSVGLQELRSGADLRFPGGVVVVDGETEQDLACAARTARGEGFLYAGPSAFAEHVARAAGLPRGPAPLETVTGPWLVLSGSLNAVSLAQVRAAQRRGACLVRLGPERVYASAPATGWLTQAAARTGRAWDQGRLVVLHTALRSAERQEYLAAAARGGLDAAAAARQLTARLTQTGATLLERLARGGALAFGGETARALAERLGLRRMQAVREVVPGSGVLLGRPTQRPLLLATKSGAFGNEDFLKEFKSCCWE
jgi:uncharacterized protein YgbK (DUF1537 family)